MKLHILFSMILATLLWTGCIFGVDTALPECDPEESLILNLNLSVPLSAIGTRNGGHDTDPGSEAESYIDLVKNDYQIHVFDKDGAYVDGKLSEIQCKENGVSGENVSYTLSAKLSLSGNEDKERLSTFRVMVLANWMSFERSNTNPSYGYPSFANYSLSGDAPRNILKNGADFNFTLKEQDNNYSWIPSISDTKKQSIPMFGISKVLDLQYVIDMAKYGDEPVFNVPMLRAIAKVEIIDETDERIGSVSISNVNKRGRFIPEIDENTNANWSENNTQIETPSLPTDPDNIKKIEFVQGPDIDGKRTWVAYIPEMDLNRKRPDITVYDGSTALAPTPFNNYENGKVVTDPSKFLPAVLRNHIYSFRVNISDRASVSIKMDILPWDMEYDDSPWYYDSPNVETKLEWFPDAAETDKVIINQDKVDAGEEEPKYSYNGFVDDTGELKLIMKEGTEEYAEASFQLSAPKNCIWHAELVFLEGRPDAFYFVDENGEEIKTNNGCPTGIINGTAATIRIKNRHEQVETNPNEMRLVIFVEYPDNISREVKVVNPVEIPDDTAEGGKKTINNYTIVQNRTDIY